MQFASVDVPNADTTVNATITPAQRDISENLGQAGVDVKSSGV
jgi:hypothetical protein